MTENYEWLNCIPTGWMELGREMIEKCEAIDPDYEVCDMKEKWGHLDVISTSGNYDIATIEEEYWKKSTEICAYCGKPAIMRTISGWILPICDDCMRH